VLPGKVGGIERFLGCLERVGDNNLEGLEV